MNSLISEVKDLKAAQTSTPGTPGVRSDESYAPGVRSDDAYNISDTEDTAGTTGLSCPFNNIGLSDLDIPDSNIQNQSQKQSNTTITTQN